MVSSHGDDAAARQAGTAGPGGKGAHGGPSGPAEEHWYQIAREAAQILVGALALYASIKGFMEKMKKRRELRRQKEV